MIMIYLYVTYRHIPILYLPSTWSYPLTWFLSYPCEPGIISGLAWLTICRAVVGRRFIFFD
jgi:hypothetical protein